MPLHLKEHLREGDIIKELKVGFFQEIPWLDENDFWLKRIFSSRKWSNSSPAYFNCT